MLNAVLMPLSGAMGADYKAAGVADAPGSPRSPKRVRGTDKNHRQFFLSEHETPEAKESALIGAFGRAGFRVKAMPAKPPG